MKFTELNLDDSVLEALDAMNFSECTPIQEKTIPVLLKGCDVIGVAQTGTGKTAAYLLPVINKLCTGNYPKDAVNCLIMSPTRELAQQIDQQMEGFAYFMPVSSVAVYGGNDGVRFEQEKRGLTLGADVIIATPGRLISHIQMGYVDLSKVSFFILDEADRMLDMGFYDDIMQIVKLLPKNRQTLMFSATMPVKIQQLAKNILNNPVEVKIAVSKPAEKIIQTAYICYEPQKMGIIHSLFKDNIESRILIFASSKQKVKDLTNSLKRMHLNVGEMHSDLDQSQRDEIMNEFKAGRVNILVATDIVARGIDIDDIRLVINYDVPHDSEDYVHRIGRTARANNDGCAITLVNEEEQFKFKQIEDFLGKEIYKIPVPSELGESPAYEPKKNSFKGKRPNHRQPSKQKQGNKGNRSNRQHERYSSQRSAQQSSIRK
ncbi:MAG: DEAD/DEAH box helicase [Phocaeicola sp.]|uniref:DEAD/DEAH box helicase n=1 Tax=Phocaeicola sp. TaxID=2773926 RepID=UPI003FA0C207